MLKKYASLGLMFLIIVTLSCDLMGDSNIIQILI